MFRKLRHLTAGLLIVFLLAGIIPVTTAEAAVKKPANCRFVSWKNSSFTSCRVAWDKVSGLGGSDYYEIRWTHTDGSSYHHRYQYSSINVLDIKNLSPGHIYKVAVRTVKTNGKAITGFSSWSNTAFITPMPTSISLKLTDRKKRHVKIGWNKIQGASGYAIWLATSPAGKWTLHQSVKSGRLSAAVTNYKKGRLKTNFYYYVRIFPLPPGKGKTASLPVPSVSYYTYRFKILNR